MKQRRTFAVVTSLALAGGLFGALAGVVTFAAGLFAMELGNGNLVWPFTIFGSIFGGLIGGALFGSAAAWGLRRGKRNAARHGVM